jgi:hypothetical protein
MVALMTRSVATMKELAIPRVNSPMAKVTARLKSRIPR